MDLKKIIKANNQTKSIETNQNIKIRRTPNPNRIQRDTNNSEENNMPTGKLKNSPTYRSPNVNSNAKSNRLPSRDKYSKKPIKEMLEFNLDEKEISKADKEVQTLGESDEFTNTNKKDLAKTINILKSYIKIQSDSYRQVNDEMKQTIEKLTKEKEEMKVMNSLIIKENYNLKLTIVSIYQKAQDYYKIEDDRIKKLTVSKDFI